MGVVWAGVHAWTDRPIAVKVLHAHLVQTPEVVDRFLQEARAATRLRHPNVVDVLDMDRDRDGNVYLVMERLEGPTFGERIADDGPLDPIEAIEVLLPVMDAVAVAHELGIVHRDLKPDNVLLSRDAWGRLVPKLLDFGIAAVLDEGRGALVEGTDIAGTPDYMAPEQLVPGAAVGPTVDVWSMAVLLFEAFSGRLPFPGASVGDVLVSLAGDEPAPSFGSLGVSLGEATRGVLDRALRRDPAARHRDMGRFADALVDALAADGRSVRVVRPSRDGGDLGAAAGAVWAPSVASPRRVSGLRPVEAAGPGEPEAPVPEPVVSGVLDVSGVQRTGSAAADAGAPADHEPADLEVTPGPFRWTGRRTVGVVASVGVLAVVGAVAVASGGAPRTVRPLVDVDRVEATPPSAAPPALPDGRDVPPELAAEMSHPAAPDAVEAAPGAGAASPRPGNASSPRREKAPLTTGAGGRAAASTDATAEDQVARGANGALILDVE